MKFLADIEVEEGLKDSSGDLGSNGQILSSTGSGTNWIAAGGTIGGSITDNRIAVGASTANNIEGSDNFSYIPLTIGSVTSARFRVKGRLEMSDNLTSGTANLYIGSGAGSTSSEGANTGVGKDALGDQISDINEQGVANSALGYSALTDLTLGSRNIGIGYYSLRFLTGTGQNDNTAVGTNAARHYSTGTDQLTQSSQGVYIGSDTRASANNISNEIAIGYGAIGGGSDTITLGNSSVDLLRIPGLGSTNGHVLTYNTAAGGFILAAGGGGGGGIGGSITAGQVAFGDTTNDEITGSSALTFTSSNTLKLDNGGSTGSTPNLVLNKGSFGTSKILMQNAGTTKLEIKCDSADDSVVTASGRLTLTAGGVTPHVIMASASSSNVGIGVTLPTTKLQVAGTIYSSQASGEVMTAGNSAYSTKYITIREGSNYAARWGLQAEDDIVTSGVMLMTSAKPMAFRSSTNIAFDSVSLSHLIIRASSTNGSANVGIGTDDPKSKLQVAGGVQISDDTDTASVDKVGTFRYRTATIGSFDYSYVDMCMQTDTTTYEWVNIVTNRWT